MVSRIVIVCVSFLVALATNEEGQKWLAEKTKEKDVVTLKSGLMYKVLKAGDGDSHPTVDSPTECHYAGTLIDGKEFDSSYKRGKPTAFAPKQVIKGWTEAMQLMVEGDKWEMYIPSELAYGDRGSGAKIPGGSALIFTMEMLKIKGNKVPKGQKATAGGGAKAAADGDLHKMARANDPDGVKELLVGNADINALGNGGQTPLMASVLGGATKSVEVLLAHKADTTIGEKDGYTPFHGSGFQGRADIAKLLFEHGLDPLDTHKDGYIGMHRACWGRESRHAQTVKAFIEMGVDPEYKVTGEQRNGKTCMEMTSNKETKEVLAEAVKSKAEM